MRLYSTGLAGSVSALTLAATGIVAEWQVPSPSTASFQIARIDPIANADLVAPVALWFTPVNIAGFVGFDGVPISAPTDPAVNTYDPTALEIFWSWDFGDSGYTPLVTPNIPTSHRDTNRAFTKRPCHVFRAGAKTVSLYGYDSAGNWATATYVFAETPGAQAPVIAAPDDYFEGADTIFFSPAGIFPASPPAGALLATTVSAVNSRIRSRSTQGRRFSRLRFRRGEIYTDIGGIGDGENASDASGNITTDRNVYVDAYNDPLGLSTAPPIHRAVNTGTAFNIVGRCPRMTDQDFQGPHDDASETGRQLRGVMSPTMTMSPYFLYDRMRVSGFDYFLHRLGNAAPNGAWRIFSDTSVTNWKNYGIFGGGEWQAIIGCDLFNSENALGGIDNGSSSNTYEMGNLHGPSRFTLNRDTYVACSAFFCRVGWSSHTPAGAGNTIGPTAHQPVGRFQREFRTYLNYTAVERCSFEGGSGVQLSHANLDGLRTPTQSNGANFLVDMCLIVASRESSQCEIGLGGLSSAVRNCYFIVPDVPVNRGFRFGEFINAEYFGSPDPANPSKYFVHNNTILLLGDDSDLGTGARVVGTIAAGHNPVIENNILYGPNLSTVLGPEFAPLGTSPLAGFTPRYKGVRFNFPPIGHPRGFPIPGAVGGIVTPSQRREGGAGPVAPGQWMSFPYPNYSAFCNGALGQVTRAMCEAALPGGGARFHQVSMANVGTKIMSTAAAGDNRNLVAFDFTDSAIRVQNNSTNTWSAGAIYVLLDLRDRLMNFVPGTASPTTIPNPVPGGGSAALNPVDYTGLAARTDFTTAVRSTFRNDAGSIVSGALDQGGFAG